jgi:hypothetical protein
VQRMGAAPSMPTAAEIEAALAASRPGESGDDELPQRGL